MQTAEKSKNFNNYPCFNSEKYLSYCIDSVLSQNIGVDNLEILCIDDASTDQSVYILEKYKDKCESIIILKNTHNKGVSSTRNLGLRAATGKYIMFLDSDDMLSENTCHDVYKFFENNSDKIDVVTYDVYNFDGKNMLPGPKCRFVDKNKIIDLTQEFKYVPD